MEITTPMYVVVLAAGAGDDAPKYNGACVAGVYTTLDESKAKVRKIADEWKENVGDDWKPGYCDDPDSAKYATNYYAEDCTTAWHDGDKSNWERVEIAYNGENNYGYFRNI